MELLDDVRGTSCEVPRSSRFSEPRLVSTPSRRGCLSDKGRSEWFYPSRDRLVVFSGIDETT